MDLLAYCPRVELEFVPARWFHGALVSFRFWVVCYVIMSLNPKKVVFDQIKIKVKSNIWM